MAEPIIEFKDKAEAIACMKEWQHRLYLDDWIIALWFEDYKNMPTIGDAGTTNLQMVNKCATITICNRAGADDGIGKFCQERVLVHELLHLIYNWIEGHSYEEFYMQTLEHQRLELMARSLIMAKYNIGPEWFNNVKE